MLKKDEARLLEELEEGRSAMGSMLVRMKTDPKELGQAMSAWKARAGSLLDEFSARPQTRGHLTLELLKNEEDGDLVEEGVRFVESLKERRDEPTPEEVRRDIEGMRRKYEQKVRARLESCCKALGAERNATEESEVYLETLSDKENQAGVMNKMLRMKTPKALEFHLQRDATAERVKVKTPRMSLAEVDWVSPLPP